MCAAIELPTRYFILFSHTEMLLLYLLLFLLLLRKNVEAVGYSSNHFHYANWQVGRRIIYVQCIKYAALFRDAQVVEMGARIFRYRD